MYFAEQTYRNYTKKTQFCIRQSHLSWNNCKLEQAVDPLLCPYSLFFSKMSYRLTKVVSISLKLLSWAWCFVVRTFLKQKLWYKCWFEYQKNCSKKINAAVNRYLELTILKVVKRFNSITMLNLEVNRFQNWWIFI